MAHPLKKSPTILPQMPKRTLAALKGSICKWKDIVAGSAMDHGVDNCSLCKVYHPEFRKITGGDYECSDKCPVKAKTGESFCLGSPYLKWANHQDRYHGGNASVGQGVECPTCKKLAKAELRFLEKLLPPSPVKD